MLWHSGCQRAVHALQAAGITTLADLTVRIPRRRQWWTAVPGPGPASAREIEEFFAAHPALTQHARALIVADRQSIVTPWGHLRLAMVAAVGGAKQFRNGRNLAAWLGLVPRPVLVGRQVSLHRRGDTYLRTLLIHGARAVLRYAMKKADSQSVWLQQLIARRGYNCAAVALANKNALVVQELLSSDSTYVTRCATA